AIGLEPLQPEHGADDVDDGVESPHLVQVNCFDGNLMDGGLDLAEALKECARPQLGTSRQRRPFDERIDLRQTPMAMRMRDGRCGVPMLMPGLMAVIVIVVMLIMIGRRRTVFAG